jgi:trehalose 6-phosphate phosphatase
VHGVVAGLELGTDVWVENKQLSATLHFRNAPDPEATRARLQAALRNLADDRLVVRPGRKSLEIRPASAGDKGTALAAVMRMARSAE